MELFSFLQPLLDPWLSFLAEDAMLRLMQGSMILVGILVVFFVFFTTRDILLRSQSFWMMLFSIVLVALVPVAGFLLYLLIRPARTIKERELERMLKKVLSEEKKIATATLPKKVKKAEKPEKKK